MTPEEQIKALDQQVVTLQAQLADAKADAESRVGDERRVFLGLQAKHDKLKASHQGMTEQAQSNADKVVALTKENGSLRKQVTDMTPKKG